MQDNNTFLVQRKEKLEIEMDNFKKNKLKHESKKKITAEAVEKRNNELAELRKKVENH